MLLNHYFRSAWRNLVTNRWYSVLNITGLAVGAAVALLIGLWIGDECTFDEYHTYYHELAQVMDVQTISGEANTEEAIAIPLSTALRHQEAGLFRHIALVFPPFTHTVGIGERKFSASGIWAEPELPEMLSLHMKNGGQDALNDPGSVLIAESLALALFGQKNPMNKLVRLDNMAVVKVAGVYEDLPLNTTFHGVLLILAWQKALTVLPWLQNYQADWGTRYWHLYVELKPGSSYAEAEARIRHIVTPMVKGQNEEAILHPMSRWHLHNEFANGRESGGRIRLLYLFGIIGAFVLLLACINFMNLSTARSARRAREVGIRKTIGSSRNQLIGQFLGESMVLSLLAFILAMGLAQLSLPFFNRLTEKQLFLPYGSISFWLLVVGLILLTGLVSGSYPALYLSRFRPVEVLKGSFVAGRSASMPRKLLLVVQFTVSVILIIGAVVVYRQLLHAKDRPVGYTREGLITVTMSTEDIYGVPYNALRNALLGTGMVTDMAKSWIRATEAPGKDTGYDWQGKDPHLLPRMGVVGVTHDFGNTVGWNILEGRDFSREHTSDSGAILVNEATARLMGMHPSGSRPATDSDRSFQLSGSTPSRLIGQSIRFDGRSHFIIGIVRDLVMGSPYQAVQPTIFTLDYKTNNAMTIRLKAGIPIREALRATEGVFKQFDPGGAFQYQFVEEEYALKFANEERIGRLALLSAILAIFISGLGLFGLASFMAEQRTKELGVRKVLGASVAQLWALLLKEFVRLVLLSLLIATPLVYAGMHAWLQQFQYRTALPWGIFAGAGAGTLLLTALTVSYQSIRAARMDPVKSLRSE